MSAIGRVLGDGETVTMFVMHAAGRFEAGREWLAVKGHLTLGAVVPLTLLVPTSCGAALLAAGAQRITGGAMGDAIYRVNVTGVPRTWRLERHGAVVSIQPSTRGA